MEGDCKPEKLGGKRILITGATGLIGSFLTDLLLYANQAYGMGMDVFILARDEKRAAERFASSMGEEGFYGIFQDVTQPLQLKYHSCCRRRISLGLSDSSRRDYDPCAVWNV